MPLVMAVSMKPGVMDEKESLGWLLAMATDHAERVHLEMPYA